MVHLPSCQLHISLNRTAQIYLELHFCVELHTKKALAIRRCKNIAEKFKSVPRCNYVTDRQTTDGRLML